MGKQSTPAENRVVLPGVSWQQFEQVLAELGPERTARLTYDRGKLEMMTPQADHDRCNRLIESCLLVVADELYLKLGVGGPVVLKRPDLGRAIEPDATYYLQPLPPERRQVELDLTQAPGPDLAVEISMTKGTIAPLPVYAAMEIPEVWRYITKSGDDILKGQLLFYQLQDSQYIETPNSKAFPFLTAKRVLEFMDQSDSLGLQKALNLLRDWLRQRLR